MRVTFVKKGARRCGVEVRRAVPTCGASDGRRSEELAWELDQRWRARTLQPKLLEKLDKLAERWHARKSQHGGVSVRACLPARAAPA